jgi:hypothetical protein
MARVVAKQLIIKEKPGSNGVIIRETPYYKTDSCQ